MTKTIAIALAITASLVGSESFAGGRALGPGQSVTLQHEITIPPRKGAEVGKEVLKKGDRYLLLVQDASPKNGPIVDAGFKAFEMKLFAERYWKGSFRARYVDWGWINPGTGSQVGLEFTAGEDDPLMGDEREFEFYVENHSHFNKGPVKITLHNITPTIGLPPVLFDD